MGSELTCSSVVSRLGGGRSALIKRNAFVSIDSGQVRYTVGYSARAFGTRALGTKTGLPFVDLVVIMRHKNGAPSTFVDVVSEAESRVSGRLDCASSGGPEIGWISD
jgi:hypothetical protein